MTERRSLINVGREESCGDNRRIARARHQATETGMAQPPQTTRAPHLRLVTGGVRDQRSRAVDSRKVAALATLAFSLVETLILASSVDDWRLDESRSDCFSAA